ncbi:hypothetical protein TIFTF001_051881, partial [Ficus carica]
DQEEEDDEDQKEREVVAGADDVLFVIVEADSGSFSSVARVPPQPVSLGCDSFRPIPSSDPPLNLFSL